MTEGTEQHYMTRVLRNRWFQFASALGVIFGLIGFITQLPPVSEWLFGKRTAMNLEVVSQLPVFNVSQPVPGLSVVLEGQDLTSGNQGLVAARLRLRNSGDVSITPANTTSADPLGIAIQGGTIVRLNRYGATSSHLRNLARPQRREQSLLLPSSLIFDPGDYVEFDLVIRRPNSGKLRFIPLGKVEGVKSINVSSTPPASSSIRNPWSGSLATQIVRTLTYPFIAIALVFAIVLPIVGMTEWRDRRHRASREQLAAKVAVLMPQKDSAYLNIAEALYVGAGFKAANWLLSLSDENRLSNLQDWRRHFCDDDDAEVWAEYDPASVAARRVISKISEGGPVGFISHQLASLNLMDDENGAIDEAVKAVLKEFLDKLDESTDEARLKRIEPSLGEFAYYIEAEDDFDPIAARAARRRLRERTKSA